MIELYIDAATAGNPGPSAIGIFIKGEGQLIKIGESIGENDNHTTEFIALVQGLKEALKLSTGIISVRSDSKIVVASIEKEYVKNEAYKPYLEEALELSRKFDLFFIKWIPDSENRAADALAREALRTNQKRQTPK
ncbi:ribonuclease HI family protein [Viridibacillus sp. YIM B01967]|uniref:Ribonuclease HI family protein n=1 Tax=Viridibacillus soli TaxID=2798301 RepID=A0ABS1H6B7_9BACL|nr:ribonuclease HI family protein [Viridibacillus soli]MBK3494962.1 ribonuclease HI family protein [Viridibacillus soli]